MAYLVMDDCLGLMFEGGPAYNTSIVTVDGGGEDPAAHWTNAKRDWRFGEARTLADIATLEVFFHEVMGRFRPFLFKDWADHKSSALAATPAATDQAIGTGDGTTASFYLTKKYGTTNPRTRRIVPKSGTVLVAVDAVLKTETTHFTVNYDTGQITFTGGNIPTAGQAITAGFEFYCLVRFDEDRFNRRLNSRQRKYASVDIGLVEVPL